MLTRITFVSSSFISSIHSGDPVEHKMKEKTCTQLNNTHHIYLEPSFFRRVYYSAAIVAVISICMKNSSIFFSVNPLPHLALSLHLLRVLNSFENRREKGKGKIKFNKLSGLDLGREEEKVKRVGSPSKPK